MVRTVCPYCGVGCGILASVSRTGNIAIKGDPDHPANFGRLCSKGAALNETVDHNDRLLYPEIDGKRVDWDAVLDKVAGTLKKSIQEYGPQSVAFYVSGQLLTEDYYVANKLMKGFIGVANIDTNSRLCMSSAVAGHKRAFGADIVPCDYADLDQADLIVIIGSNTAWCHPVIYQRIVKAKTENPALKIVVIDPRRTATCEHADLHLPLKPGTDVVLFNGLLNHLHQVDALDREFLTLHTEGFTAAINAADNSAPSISHVARVCDLPEPDVAEFFRLFTSIKKTISLFSQGVNQSSSGTDKVNAIINCHLATGRIGKRGTGPFSITGQPNAMGGREVGGLSNQLAAHMEIENPGHRDRVQRFWNAPVIADKPGLKAVDLFEAVYRGDIRVLWIMATNPVVSMPDADRVRAALQRCEMVIVSDCIRLTDTAVHADVLLPALAWGEKDGTVTNSERRISRQRKFLPVLCDARPDWWIITQVARRMGFAEAFPYETPDDVFREHAALSGFENNGERDFDISALADLDSAGYDNLNPVQWPASSSRKINGHLFSDGRFFHPGGKARFVAVEPCNPAHATDAQYPLILNTGRVRDHWHTLTRTGKSPRLSAHTSEPYIEIHPEDAQLFDLDDGILARVQSRWGSAIARTRFSKHQYRGSLFIPMHWNDQFASSGRIDAVVNPVVDPISGQPELKHTPVRISRVETTWEGFFLTRDDNDIRPSAPYWTRSRCHGHWCYEIAGEKRPENWSHWARSLMQADEHQSEWLEYSDATIGRYRAASIWNGRLENCLFIAPDHSQLPDRNWLQELFKDKTLEKIERACLLAGKPTNDRENSGPIICSCFTVGRNTILKTVIEHDIKDIESIGRLLQAGTNCGSCIPEIRELL